MNVQPKIITNITEIPEERCDHCKMRVFAQGYRVKIVPALQSKTGHPDPLVSVTWYCVSCKRENIRLRGVFQEVTKLQENQPKIIH